MARGKRGQDPRGFTSCSRPRNSTHGGRIKIGSGIFNQRRVKKRSGFLRECSGRDGAGKGWQLPPPPSLPTSPRLATPFPGGTWLSLPSPYTPWACDATTPPPPHPPSATNGGCDLLPAASVMGLELERGSQAMGELGPPPCAILCRAPQHWDIRRGTPGGLQHRAAGLAAGCRGCRSCCRAGSWVHGVHGASAGCRVGARRRGWCRAAAGAGWVQRARRGWVLGQRGRGTGWEGGGT